MAVVVTVNSVVVPVLEGTITYNKSVDGPHIASFVVQSVAGVSRPVRDQDVTITVDGTRRFGGLVDMPDEASTGGEPQSGSNDYTVNAIGYGIYADWRNVVNGGFVEGTLLVSTALPALLGFLSPNGVTLDTTGVPPYALPHSPYDVRTITSISDEIAAMFDLAWEIDENKVYRWFVPGTEAAPFNISDGNNDNDVGDLTVEYANQDVYNYVFGRLGSGQREVMDSFTGDGATTTFQTSYFPLAAHRGYVLRHSTEDEYETLTIDAADPTATWDYTTSTGILTRLTAVPNGEIVDFIYTAQFPITITSDGATTPIKELVIDLPTIFDPAAGQLIIDLARITSMANPRLIHYRTRRHGLEPGMFQTVTYSKRNLNNIIGYIQEVSARHEEGDVWVYDVTFLEGLSRVNGWKSIYREWSELGGGGASTTVSNPPPSSSGGAAPPNHAVQFNLAGAFGGDASFTWNPDTNCLIAGLDSTITAENPESCAILGDDNHIVDP